MRSSHYIIRITVIASGLALAAAGALAQSSGDGEGLMRQGVEAISRGEFEAATLSFSKAMRSGDLSDAQIAKALYQRGLAHQKLGKPAHAIADISSALWLGGLSGDERARAYTIRSQAYEAVGMKDLAQADLERAGAPGASAKTTAQKSNSGEAEQPSAPPVPSFSTRVEKAERQERETSPGRPEQRVSAFQTRVNPESRPEPEPSGPPEEPAASFRTRVEAEQEKPERKTRKPVPEFRTSIMPEEKPRQQKQRKTEETKPGAEREDSGSASENGQSKSTVTGLLGSLWRSATGGGEDEKTASAAPAAAAQWGESTKVDGGNAPSNGASSSPAGEGRYRIQLAALRSEDEAQATWERLVSRHQDLLGGREPLIEKTELGQLGTVYRVQLGPFSDKTESLRLCNEFKRNGMDCFLLTR